jgi:CubicO group peptidase (beta-lactamase class C family)
MTATLVARMIETDRHLTWDTTVGDILGDDIPGMDPAYRSVTFRHLLTHRSGLPASLDPVVRNAFPRPGEVGTPADPRPDRLRWATSALLSPPQAAAGAKMIYSNSGYIIAGAMLENVCAKPWEDLITDQVFVPLGLPSAGFFAPGTSGRLDQPLGHSYDPAAPDSLTPIPLGTNDHHTDNPVAMAPSGGVHMNLADLLKYLRAHLNCPHDYLSEASWKALHTPLFGGNYAMGWFVNKDGVLSHDGTNTLWFAMVKINPTRGLVSAATANDDRQTTEYSVRMLVDDALLRT